MNTYRLKLETEAAQRLRERIVAEYGEDAELIRDMVEGETDLRQMLDYAARELACVEGEEDGMATTIEIMKSRQARHIRRADAIREAILAALEAAELTAHKTPAATLSMRPAPPRVTITDAALLPAIYVTQPAPVPDKRAIGAALKAGEAVPGAELSNQPPSLSVRFS